ncbi:hypothetical protein PAMA_005751 [Pampus argenteus]
MDHMDLVRKYMWLWVIIGMVFVSVVTCLIFMLIYKCISSSGKHRILQIPRSGSFSQENKYQEKVVPSLPPRTQFLTAEAQSYENLAEVPNCEQDSDDVHDYEETVDDGHDYEQNIDDDHDYEQNIDDVHDYEQNIDGVHDYEQNIDDVHDYEQSMDNQSDYVKVEDEELMLPPPPYEAPDPAADNASTEDYDDIGGEDEEDYDDVA